MNVQQNLSPPPEMHSSDSDDGLPPPIPTKKPPFILGFKLNVAGLGISTLAQGDGQTAEQMADSQVLKQSIQQKKLIQLSDRSDDDQEQIPIQS